MATLGMASDSVRLLHSLALAPRGSRFCCRLPRRCSGRQMCPLAPPRHCGARSGAIAHRRSLRGWCLSQQLGALKLASAFLNALMF
jgi:hypothetical protein